ncbi:MAG: hypothetical protein E7601_08530 [Ruminococcaceae bacterium]|nr:hypothetical protein [Oscillospiraceae bacterium]MBO4971409.1 hypothetical protein [Clostridia bacterium]MBQ1259383.1 hypothetical protein [Clostridia bacterium]
MSMNTNGVESAKMLVEMLKSADNASSGKNDPMALLAMRSLFDNQSFVRLSAFMTRSQDDCEAEGVVCAYGSVHGKPVFAFSEDVELNGGAISKRHVEKIKSLYKRAKQNGAPVVAFFNSKGGALDEGSAMLSAYGELIDCICSSKGLIPQLAVVNGKCTGLLASAAELFDFTVGVKGCEMYFLPPFIVGEKYSSEEYLEKNGLVSFMADDTRSASEYVRELLGKLPLNVNDSRFLGDTEDDINRTVSTAFDEKYDIKALISDIADDKSFTELYPSYAGSMRVGFAAFDGILCGVVANDHSVNDGAITADGCKKAAGFIEFCSRFAIPVLTLVDTKGFEVSADNEEAGVMSASAKLALAYSRSPSAKITVIIGKAYGAGFTLMGSRSLGADEVLALKDALVSAMPPESAVAFMNNRDITADKDRKAVEDEWIAKNCPAVLAAANGDIDDIIDSTFLRAHICTAVGMFSSKSNMIS